MVFVFCRVKCSDKNAHLGHDHASTSLSRSEVDFLIFFIEVQYLEFLSIEIKRRNVSDVFEAVQDLLLFINVLLDNLSGIIFGLNLIGFQLEVLVFFSYLEVWTSGPFESISSSADHCVGDESIFCDFSDVCLPGVWHISSICFIIILYAQDIYK